MVLTLLGNLNLSVGEDWQNYNPIFLLSNRAFAVQALTNSANPGFIYGYILIRYQVQDNESEILRSQPIAQIFYDSGRQFFLFNNIPLFQVNGQIRFQAKRISFYRNPSQLSDVSLALAIDPENNSPIQTASMQLDSGIEVV